MPALKYSIMINGITRLFMTKADVMSGFKSIKICMAYKSEGKVCKEIPFSNETTVEPEYIEMPGWAENISGFRQYAELPLNLKKYIEFIEKETGLPITLISVGPDRKETIIR
jgi:adenylosuccinate synthase